MKRAFGAKPVRSCYAAGRSVGAIHGNNGGYADQDASDVDTPAKLLTAALAHRSPFATALGESADPIDGTSEVQT